MRFPKRLSQQGFSLVELMIVVAIIGVLAALAVPRFQTFQAKAKASESRTSLAHIYTLEQSYYGDNDMYGTLDQINFSLNGTVAAANAIAANPGNKIRYSYTSNFPTAGGLVDFQAIATSAARALGGCQTGAHIVGINEQKQIRFGGAGSVTPPVAQVDVIPGC